MVVEVQSINLSGPPRRFGADGKCSGLHVKANMAFCLPRFDAYCAWLFKQTVTPILLVPRL